LLGEAAAVSAAAANCQSRVVATNRTVKLRFMAMNSLVISGLDSAANYRARAQWKWGCAEFASCYAMV
jgi:hypothetical protein